MATLVPTTKSNIQAFNWNGPNDKNYFDRAEKALNDLYAVSDALPDGDVNGLMISFPIADGKAYYRVVSTKPLKLEHIPFGDAWHISDIMIRGLRINDILAIQKQNRAWKALFAKHAAKKAA